MTVQAADWTGVYAAFHNWIWRSTGIAPDRVRAQINRDYGEAKGPGPKATISLISVVETSQPSRKVKAMVMRQRYTVIADGPGEVGVDFYPGKSLTPQRISIVAGPGDLPATSAAALLAELVANLPVGYTASADLEDPASVIVDGTEAQPEFAALPADASMLTVATPIPRWPYLVRLEHRVVWRVLFRGQSVAAASSQADVASGPRFAADLMSRAQVHRRALLDRDMRRLGFRPLGTPNSQPDVPSDRSESTAVLDVAFLGLFTGAEAATSLRATGFTATAT